VNKKAEKDATYSHSFKVFADDEAKYKERSKKYEWWSVRDLHQGRAIPSEYRMKRLSVIMPIWNCKEYVEKTFASLMEQTNHPYELILIDDCSTEFDGEAYIEELAERARERFLTVKTVCNKEQRYCNSNWNKGVELATGDYIAIINSDIEFQTHDWDDYLIENIDLGYQLVNPYQSDRIYPDKPYMKPPHEDFLYRLNIRGACFMLSRDFAKQVFPIPKQLTHWTADNYISRKAKDFMYDIRVSIYHHISKSGEKVDQCKFWTMVQKDVFEYVKLTGDDMSLVANNCAKNVKYYCHAKRI
jgi:glycosyltransferase involved in cell wall biosynthesis